MDIIEKRKYAIGTDIVMFIITYVLVIVSTIYDNLLLAVMFFGLSFVWIMGLYRDVELLIMYKKRREDNTKIAEQIRGKRK